VQQIDRLLGQVECCLKLACEVLQAACSFYQSNTSTLLRIGCTFAVIFKQTCTRPGCLSSQERVAGMPGLG
jgi:hypothetical protein